VCGMRDRTTGLIKSVAEKEGRVKFYGGSSTSEYN
jgi:hypothetical protein